MASDDREGEAARLFAQGLSLGSENRWPEAEASFSEAVQLMPASSLAWLGGAIACWNQKRFAEAAHAAEWALHAIPIRDTPQSQEGLARFEAADWAGVQRAFRVLLETPPVDTPTYLFLCIAYVNLGRIDEAGQQLMAAWRQELADSEPEATG
jgi:Flp pilus assembly protein TadD